MSNVFKKQEEILQPAPQNKSLNTPSLEDWHRSVSEITLDENVPERIKFYFEAAKNVLLYSWFSYEMMPAAELLSYTLVERSLRVKYKCENQHRPGFAVMIKQAVKDGILNDGGFHVPGNSVRREFKMEDGEFSVTTYKRTKEELEACQNYIGPICESLNIVRNILAHGETYLHPSSWLTLKVNSEIINMLFNSKITPTPIGSNKTN